jgi:hypothetical protein
LRLFFLDTQTQKAGRESRPVTVRETGNTVTGAGRLLTGRRARREECVKSREKTGQRKSGEFGEAETAGAQSCRHGRRVVDDVVVVVVVMVVAMTMVVMAATVLPASVPRVRDRHPLPRKRQAAAETKGSVRPAARGE